MKYNFLKALSILVMFLWCWPAENQAQTLSITGTWRLNAIIKDVSAVLKIVTPGPDSTLNIPPDDMIDAYHNIFAELDLTFSADGKVFFENLEERDPGGFYSPGAKSDTYEWTQEEWYAGTYPIVFLDPDRIQIILICGVKMIFKRRKED